MVDQRPEIKERLDRIDECAQMVGEIPGRALLPVNDQVEPMDINLVLHREVSRWCADEEGLAVEFGGLAGAKLTVLADPKWLAVVLEMLITNAIRAMKDVERKRLSVLSEARGSRAVIEFTNSGPEISEHIRGLLFKEPIPKRQGAEGSGVGLLIARTIVHRYGGDVELARSTPEGTTFSLWLPLHNAHART